MLCPNCHKNEAGYKKFLGVIPCESCRVPVGKLSKQIEFTTNNIKEGRKEYADDIIQPFRDGHVSKEFIDRYGTSKVAISPHEAKTARNVWLEDKYYD